MTRALTLAMVLLFGCAEGSEREPLVVFAASSLTDAFEALEPAFEAAHPGTDVQLSFAGSQVLRLQIEQGAPATVFASADRAHVDALVAADALRDPQPFARSDLALIVPADSPIERFEQLDEAERIVVGSPNVPVGRYTRTLLERAASTHGQDFADTVRAHVASEESNVRLVRAKVALGEADAAFVYRTDARDMRTVPIPPELNVAARYTIGVAVGASSGAVTFAAFVRSDEGREILERHGFAGEGAP